MRQRSGSRLGTVRARPGPFARWCAVPLWARVLVALLLGVLAGAIPGPHVAWLRAPGDLALRVFPLVSPWIILVGLVHGLSRAEIRPRVWLRLLGMLAAHNLVAVCIGLLLGNLVQPGRWINPLPIGPVEATHELGSWSAFFHRIPRQLVQSVTRHDVLVTLGGALLLGFTFRYARERRKRSGRERHRRLEAWLEAGKAGVEWWARWLPEVLPLVVFCTTTGLSARHGLRAFPPLAVFVLTVLVGLSLQVLFYLARARLRGRLRPWQLLRAGGDAILTAFSLASSTVAMPVAHARLQERAGLREEPSSLGTLIGANFSKDGTVLYLTLAAMFTAQAAHLPFGIVSQLQLLMVLASLLPRTVTSGAAGAGFPTMAMVFWAVGLPLDYVPLLLTVDWFLDRCRSAVNILGDMTVSSILATDFDHVPPGEGDTGESPL